MSEKKQNKKTLNAKPPPSPREAEAITLAEASMRRRPPPPPVGLTNLTPQSFALDSPHSDRSGWLARLQRALGTCSASFIAVELGRIATALKSAGGVIDPRAIDAVVAVLDGQKPKDEIEAMLVIQMAVTHALAMEKAYHLSLRSPSIQQQDSNGLALHRLTRAFTAQSDALAKLRRGGEQKVTVEHVHIYPGGQAIVGNVTQSPVGGGILENTGQPHAASDPRALALAAGPAMLCQDAQREAVPVADSSGKKPLPDARRGSRVGGTEGRAKRQLPPRSIHRNGNGRARNVAGLDS